MEAPAQPGRAVLELSLRVLSLKFCCKHLCPPPGAMCAVCVLSSGPAPALLLECSPGRERALPSPVEYLSVLVCVGS